MQISQSSSSYPNGPTAFAQSTSSSNNPSSAQSSTHIEFIPSESPSQSTNSQFTPDIFSSLRALIEELLSKVSRSDKAQGDKKTNESENTNVSTNENVNSSNKTEKTSLENSVIPGGTDYPVGASVAGDNPIERLQAKSNESFEGGGWNVKGSKAPVGFTPGFDKSLPQNFRFTQFQNDEAFTDETNITRLGDHSARLLWKHEDRDFENPDKDITDPAQFNGDKKKLDNVDRKAMLHGKTANSSESVSWHGFSTYFPSDETELSDSHDPLFFQLHGSPDKIIDPETNKIIDNEPGREPPLAFNLTNEGIEVGYGWDSREFAKDTKGEGREKFLIPLDMAEFKDNWADFVVKVDASPESENGSLEIWLNGKQVAKKTDIQIGYNDDKGLYPSWGWYQTGKENPERDSNMAFYLDEVRHVEHPDAGYFDVAPGYFEQENN